MKTKNKSQAYPISPSAQPIGINPMLDFTLDTAYVGVKIAPSNTIAVVTSDGRIIPWNEKDLTENNICSEDCPAMLQPNWTKESINDFLNGAKPPASTEIHHRIRSYLRKYLGLRHPAEYDLITYWIMGSYLKPLFKCYPILFFNAPHESGKSRCLEVVSQLSLNGEWFGEITPAAFRRYAGSRITFCLDELKEIGLKNDSPLISILLNAYNSAKVAIADPSHNGGRLPTIFKVTSPVAIGNIRDIKNEALKSRTIQIRPEYDPGYKNTILPGIFDSEPARIRDGLYTWFLSHWQLVRESYQTYPEVPNLSARETDSYKPLLAIAALVGPETVQALIDYANAAREEKILSKKAVDDRLDLLLFIRDELEARGLVEALPIISNRILADAYGRKNNLRVNYRRFLEMVDTLHVVSDIKVRHNGRYLVFNRAEIDRQLRLIEAKS